MCVTIRFKDLQYMADIWVQASLYHIQKLRSMSDSVLVRALLI